MENPTRAPNYLFGIGSGCQMELGITTLLARSTIAQGCYWARWTTLPQLHLVQPSQAHGAHKPFLDHEVAWPNPISRPIHGYMLMWRDSLWKKFMWPQFITRTHLLPQLSNKSNGRLMVHVTMPLNIIGAWTKLGKNVGTNIWRPYHE